MKRPLGYDAIVKHVMNEGHFLGGEQTMGSMLRDYYYPKLANRDNPTIWAEIWLTRCLGYSENQSERDTGSTTRRLCGCGTDDAIRERFNIYIPKEYVIGA